MDINVLITGRGSLEYRGLKKVRRLARRWTAVSGEDREDKEVTLKSANDW